MAKPELTLTCDPDQVALLNDGVETWNAWRKNHPDAPIQLANAELARMDLSYINLEGANLRHANLLGATLNNAVLNKADLSEATLTEADLTDASLCRATITGVNFWYANLTNVNTINIIYTKKGMKDQFFGIRGIESTWGDSIFKRMATDQSYIDSIHWHWQNSNFKLLLFRLWGLIDYGRSVALTLGFALLFIALFGVLYSFFPAMVGLNCECGADKCARHGWFSPFYFSVVTYTTLGFGDIAPQTIWGEVAVAFEVVLGYMTLGLLSSVLANKVAQRS